jgi:hypothetical protein
MLFQMKSVPVEAEQYTGFNILSIRLLLHPIPPNTIGYRDGTKTLWIWTEDGDVQAEPGDWVIRSTKNQCIVKTNEEFLEEYAPVNGGSS